MAKLIDLGESLTACTVTGSGPALLLMHGAEGNHHMFDALVEQLAPYFTVIAYDQRDCGETENAPTPVSLLDLARDASALIAALGHERVHVYGSSFGGRLAQTFAHQSPHAVGKLVLGSTWALPDALAELNGPAVQEIQALRARLPDSAEALAEYFLPAAHLQAHPHLKGMFRSAQPHSERSARRQHAVGECLPLKPADLRVPTLVIAGELDRVVPPQLTLAMAAAIPGARALLLPGIGHAAAIQAPELVAAQLSAFCRADASTTSEARP